MHIIEEKLCSYLKFTLFVVFKLLPNEPVEEICVRFLTQHSTGIDDAAKIHIREYLKDSKKGVLLNSV